MYQANFDLTRIRALPMDELRKFFPRACYIVTGEKFRFLGGFHAVEDSSSPTGTKAVPNGRREALPGATFRDTVTARTYAKRVFGDNPEHYHIGILIPEIDCPGEA